MMAMEKNADIHLKHKNLMELIKVFIFIVTSFILIVIPVFLPLGFCPDSLSYYTTINFSVSQYNFLSFEPFYWLIVYINQILFNANWTSFLLFFSVTYVILSVYLIKRYSILPVISFIIFMLLFYPNFGLIQIRNGVSIAFVWWALFDLLESKKLKFIIKIIIATFFHYSSIVFLLVLLLDKNHINKKFYLLLPLIGFLLGQYVFTIEFYQFIINYLPSFLKFKAQGYLDFVIYGPQEHKLNRINILNMYSLFNIMVYYLGLMIGSNDRYFITLEKILAFAIFSFFSFKTIPVFSFRISNDFYTFIVFLIPYILKNFKKEEKSLVYYSLVLILILLSLNIYIRHDLFNFSLL
ncbi:MAG: EpsG family protein [Thermovenabulum sp.]|uniref:EpsG family protein n=1 Tax=Thermovenabulum sp. TaxID=3100335 RepID=UPI003C7E340A